MATVVALSMMQVGVPVQARAAAPPPRLPAAGISVRTVTLVTGDRVTVVMGQRPSIAAVVPAKGRKGISFAVSQFGGRLRVVPSDAVAGLAAHRLDPRLFDISTLLEFGYDDRRPDLPLLLQGAAASAGKGFAAARGGHPVPGAMAWKAKKGELSGFWAAAAGTPLWLDGLRKPTLDVSVPQIKAPAAWAAGYTGAGVKVAVVDTGIDATHPDLAGKVVAARDFLGDGEQDFVGHGTHVAATIASNDTRYRGVAFGAQLISAKVCGEFGCPESAILEGMQWAVEQGAKVVNMSLGGADSPGIDPLEAAVQDLTARYGALFVIAAGNAGGDETVGSPGSADAALTVGAVDKQDQLAGFSSRGPRVGDAALKPDVTAPGVNIVAAYSKDAPGGSPGGKHVSLSGTSMATPHVTGAAAILAQQHPTWTPAQLKAALMGSAMSNPDIPIFAEGAGRIDVSRATTQKILADPGGVSFGRQAFPHNDDEVLTRTITYANTGNQGVTLSLSLREVPAAMFALSANTVTVPAGGTATVTLTADTRVAVPDGKYGGYVVAQAAETVVSTPFAVDKEDERYNVTMTPTGRDGNPSQSTGFGLIDPVAGLVFLPDFGGTQTVRVPKGHYMAMALIIEDTAVVMLAEPEVNVDHDLTIGMDARRAAPVEVSLPLKDAAPALAVLSAVVGFAEGNGAFLAIADSGIGLYSGSSDPTRTSPHLTGAYAAFFTRGGGPASDSPYLAETAWHQPGRVFQGLTRRLARDDLATLDVTYAGQDLGQALVRFGPSWPDLRSVDNPINLGAFTALPSARLEYHNTDDALQWAREMYELDADGFLAGNVLFGPATTLRAGTTIKETRNQAVFGPGFTDPAPSDLLWLSRKGDTMVLVPTLANDKLNWDNQPADGAMRLTLDRNGERLLDTVSRGEAIDVPPGEASYRLESELTRLASPLSTKVSCVWTFRSGTTGTGGWARLPLSVVRFLPLVDEHDTGKAAVLPLQVQRQAGSAAGAVRSLTVEVSYDDGATWREVPVVRLGQTGFAVLNHPAGAEFISLRSESTDTSGNTVNETIIRAYRVR
jgi:subtilisin family serine protease